MIHVPRFTFNSAESTLLGAGSFQQPLVDTGNHGTEGGVAYFSTAWAHATVFTLPNKLKVQHDKDALSIHIKLCKAGGGGGGGEGMQREITGSEFLLRTGRRHIS